MKFVYFLIGIIIIASCQKDISSEDGPGGTTNPTGSNCKITRIVQGTGTDDTVYLLKYDTENLISSVIDSGYDDTVTAHYVSGVLQNATTSYGDQTSIGYNNSGQPITITTFFGNRYTLEYAANSALSKVTLYYEDNNVWKPFQYFTFESNNNGDITLIKTYTLSDVLVSQTALTYTTIPNVLAGLTPFNMDNYLGMEDVLPVYITLVKSKYLVKSIKETAGNTQTGLGEWVMNYTLTNSNTPASSVSVYTDLVANAVAYVATRKYFYECN